MLDANGLGSATAPDPGASAEPLTGETQAKTSDQTTPKSAGAAADGWHSTVLLYLWLPGVHGTVGAGGYTASVHASPADLLSNFRFGLMGTADFRYKRLVLPVDMVWVRLGDDKAAPPNELGLTSADMKVAEFILTPMIGYRAVDQEKVKIDALGGFRYWHFGQDLQFSATGGTLNFSDSQNWVDPLIGGRMIVALSPKVELTIAADVGGWGAGSELDYQMVGMLGYRIKPKWTLQAFYRYLSVNYRSGGVIFDTISSGVGLGVSIDLK